MAKLINAEIKQKALNTILKNRQTDICSSWSCSSCYNKSDTFIQNLKKLMFYSSVRPGRGFFFREQKDD